MIIVEKQFLDDAWDFLDRMRGDKIIHDFGLNDDNSFWISPLSSESSMEIAINDMIKYTR
ncbi:hypothetical protein [Caulobacter phage Cr30]|uniref:hypothetical protein n=1 Tax=Caulobacter phage Cr30 TaxID=1357714 RepID=UPI0004A9B4E0|nr:hypothetical protein OZ74_gp126 [Caulobacter phage Cr30]AGS81011.1 hypothetical protein [Caulobacter phage Cr30]